MNNNFPSPSLQGGDQCPGYGQLKISKAGEGIQPTTPMITTDKITINYIDDLQSEMQDIADRIEELWQESASGESMPCDAARELNAMFDKIKILFYR
jgi:hypothetical protein